MKTATIPSSQIAKFGRLDAGFHLLVHEFGARADELEKRFTVEEVGSLMASLSVEDLLHLEALTSGHRAGLRDTLLRAAGEYPFLALAVLEPHLNSTIRQRVDAEIAQTTALASSLDGWLVQLQIGSDPTPKR